MREGGGREQVSRSGGGASGGELPPARALCQTDHGLGTRVRTVLTLVRKLAATAPDAMATVAAWTDCAVPRSIAIADLPVSPRGLDATLLTR